MREQEEIGIFYPQNGESAQITCNENGIYC